MFVATLVLSVLLAVAFVAAGLPKIAGVKQMRENAEHLGFSVNSYRVIGALEVAGSAGLSVGLAVAPLGAAAAIGLTLLMIGAVIFHIRAKDAAAHLLPALVLALLAAATAVLRIASA